MPNKNKKKELIEEILKKISSESPEYNQEKIDSLQKRLDSFTTAQVKRCAKVIRKHTVSEIIRMFGLEDDNGTNA